MGGTRRRSKRRNFVVVPQDYPRGSQRSKHATDNPPYYSSSILVIHPRLSSTAAHAHTCLAPPSRRISPSAALQDRNLYRQTPSPSARPRCPFHSPGTHEFRRRSCRRGYESARSPQYPPSTFECELLQRGSLRQAGRGIRRCCRILGLRIPLAPMTCFVPSPKENSCV